MDATGKAKPGTGWEHRNAILRHRVERDFTVLPNTVIRDKRLGFKAFGLLVFMLHLPADFKVSVAWLSQQRRTGRHAVRAAIGELEGLGYMGVELARDDGGKFVGWVWWVTDRPQLAEQPSEPVSGFPLSGNPTSENRTLLNTKEQQEPKITTTTASDAPLMLPSGLLDQEQVVVGKLIEGLERTLAQSLLDELAGLMAANKIKTSRIGLLRALVTRARSGTYAPALAPVVAAQRLLESERASRRAVERCRIRNHDPERAKAKLAEIIEQLGGGASPQS